MNDEFTSISTRTARGNQFEEVQLIVLLMAFNITSRSFGKCLQATILLQVT